MKKIHALLKQDIIKTDKITTYKNTVTNRITHLVHDRKQLYNKLRRSDDKEVIKKQISLLSKEIFSLRKEVVLCTSIESRSLSMKQTLNRIKEERMDGELQNESWRRSRRSSR